MVISNRILLGFLLTLCFVYSTNGQAIVFGNSNTGTTPSNGGCNCVVLRQCLALFPSGNRRLTFREANEIRRRRCGYERSYIKVCCPRGDNNLSNTPPPPTPAPTPPPTTLPPYPVTLPPTCGQPTNFDRVHGGEDAKIGSQPWMVALGYRVPTFAGPSKIEIHCGGSLITTHHVVTAAHCYHPDIVGEKELVELRIGELNLNQNPDCSIDGVGRTICADPVEIRSPAKVTMHPNFHSNRRYNNDIAVIRLDRGVKFTPYIKPICLPTSFTVSNFNNYNSAYATGWGSTETKEIADILQVIRLPFAEFNVCNASFSGRLSENQLCAGGEAGRDTCFGDSGGPLIATGPRGPPFELVGVTSFGKGYCGGEGNYGVYTVVAEYRDWIVNTLRL